MVNIARRVSNSSDTELLTAARSMSDDDFTIALRRAGKSDDFISQALSAKRAFNVPSGGGLATGANSGGDTGSSLFDNANAQRPPSGSPSLSGGRDRSGLTPAQKVKEKPEPSGSGPEQAAQRKKQTEDDTEVGDAARKEAKDGEDAEAGLGQPPPKTPEEATSLWNRLKTNLPTLAALVTAAILIYAISLYIKKTTTTFNITKIENDLEQGATAVKITFNPDCTINVRDTLEISSTNSNPPINGTHAVTKYYSDTQVGINFSQRLETDGTQGTMKVDSSLVRTVASTVVQAAVDAVTPVVDTAADGIGSIIWWILGFLLLGVVVFVVISSVGSSSTSTSK